MSMYRIFKTSGEEINAYQLAVELSKRGENIIYSDVEGIAQLEGRDYYLIDECGNAVLIPEEYKIFRKHDPKIEEFAEQKSKNEVINIDIDLIRELRAEHKYLEADDLLRAFRENKEANKQQLIRELNVQRSMKWNMNNKERYNEIRRNWEKKNRAKVNKWNKDWREKNKEKQKEIAKRSYEKKRERILAKAKEYYQKKKKVK